MRTPKRSLKLFLVAAFLIVPSVHAEWIDLSKSLNELDIRAVAIHPMDPKILYASSEKRIYRSLDGGLEWKQVYSARTARNRIHSLYTNAAFPDALFVGTAEGVFYSSDRGRKWSALSKGLLKKSKSVFSLASDPENPSVIWAGTGDGVMSLNYKNKSSAQPLGLAGHQVYSLYLGDAYALASTDKGIYRRESGKSWQRVFVDGHSRLEADESSGSSLEQFDIEEMTAPRPNFSGFIQHPQGREVMTAVSAGLVASKNKGTAWSLEQSQSLPVKEIHSLAASSGTFYAATDAGLFQWDPGAGIFRDLSEGIPSKKVHVVGYSPYGDFLLIGTSQGIFRMTYPELLLVPRVEGQAAVPVDPREILARYDGEPVILDIQNAAIRYAEVHPDKIAAWRRSAALKGFLPKFSVDRDLSRDANIDLDRGGTGDPDKFIYGPEEESTDWSVGVSWDLGELVWNNDQTSIDSRSRLMVELRDDILTQVTHFYYERRRLQVETALSRTQDLATRIEKELKLQELTASIDALTGGYLTRRLKQAPPKA